MLGPLKMNKIYDYVNVFQGSGEIDLPCPKGIAATWLFIKAQCGNTTPAAAYPFGKATVCAYTGGYPTGYGDRRPNTCGKPRKIKNPYVRGFSHMHASGTGGIHAYYNYALTSPILGNALCPIEEKLIAEAAHPGYYSCTLSSGIRFEGTVSRTLAYHRYSFPESGLLAIDFSNDGLLRDDKNFGKAYYSYPEYAKVNTVSQTRVTAHIKLHGINLYFAAECKESLGISLWENYVEAYGETLTPKSFKNRFGAFFKVGKNANIRMAISFISCEAALSMLDSDSRGFDEVLTDTENVWEEFLGRIKIDSDEKDFLEIFYSNLYHSLIKPCSGGGESFLYDANKTEGKFCFDLATLWDMYKTALPLIYTLYPEISEEIAKTLIQSIKENGRSPINLTVAENNDFPDQARMMAEICLADYYFRYGKYAKEILLASETDLATHTDYLDSGYCERYTHIVDISEALYSMAQIAEENGKVDIAKRYRCLAERRVNAFDSMTGIMSTNSKYYEGDNYNYSFRLLHDMDGRISLMGKEAFISALDELFGYTRKAVKLPSESEVNPITPGLHSFEGFNNESDMEAPYAYIFADRHDRTCEILSAAHKYMFTSGEGGLPGNNDSGGLSSCYIWNCLGLFPVAGQDLMLIGSPKISSAELLLHNGKILKIKVYDNNSSHIYVDKAFFNGKPVLNYQLSVREIMAGGLLEIYMK